MSTTGILVSRFYFFSILLIFAGCGNSSGGSSKELQEKAQQYAALYLETLEIHALAQADIERWEARIVELRMLGAEAKAQRYASALLDYSQRIKQAHSEARSMVKARKDGDDYVGTAEDLNADMVRLLGLKSKIEDTRLSGNNTYEASLKDFPK